MTRDRAWSTLITTTRDAAFYLGDCAETTHGPAEAASLLLAIASVPGIAGTRFAGLLADEARCRAEKMITAAQDPISEETRG